MIEFGESIEDVHLRGLIQLMTLMEIYSDMSNEDEEEEDEVTIRRFKLEYNEMIKSVLNDVKIPAGDAMLSIEIKNNLACLYSMLGMKKDCSKLLKELDGKITSRPWAMLGMNNARDVRLYRMVGLA